MLQFSSTLRNAMLDAIEAAIGPSPKLYLYSGALPANCAASDPSGLLVEMDLPSDFMTAATGGVKSLSGSWQGVASASGTAACFRVKDTAGSVCHLQGNVTDLAGAGPMKMDYVAVISGRSAAVATFDITAGNA